MNTKYGRCPKCSGLVVSRERRPNGNDICMNGHTYPSKDTITMNSDPVEVKTKVTSDTPPITHNTSTEKIIYDIIGAIEDASRWRHDSTTWKDDEDGAWNECIQPMLERTRAAVKQLEEERNRAYAELTSLREQVNITDEKLNNAVATLKACISTFSYEALTDDDVKNYLRIVFDTTLHNT